MPALQFLDGGKVILLHLPIVGGDIPLGSANPRMTHQCLYAGDGDGLADQVVGKGVAELVGGHGDARSLAVDHQAYVNGGGGEASLLVAEEEMGGGIRPHGKVGLQGGYRLARQVEGALLAVFAQHKKAGRLLVEKQVAAGGGGG